MVLGERALTDMHLQNIAEPWEADRTPDQEAPWQPSGEEFLFCGSGALHIYTFTWVLEDVDSLGLPGEQDQGP